jgi:heme exporter protein A
MYDLDQAQERVRQVLRLVGLDTRRRDLVRQYSRGMQQRLAIGRAILHDPQLLLLDEPHTGLDQDAAEMLDEVLRDVGAQGRTVVMTSHDLMRAAGLASRIDILHRGRIVESLPREQVDLTQLPEFYRRVTHD